VLRKLRANDQHLLPPKQDIDWALGVENDPQTKQDWDSYMDYMDQVPMSKRSSPRDIRDGCILTGLYLRSRKAKPKTRAAQDNTSTKRCKECHEPETPDNPVNPAIHQCQENPCPKQHPRQAPSPEPKANVPNNNSPQKNTSHPSSMEKHSQH
jgi:hypothetical protein